MTFNFDKNQGRTLYNFTKQENTAAKSCCNFRIESNNGKRCTLSIQRQRRFARDRKASFCISKTTRQAGGSIKIISVSNKTQTKNFGIVEAILYEY